MTELVRELESAAKIILAPNISDNEQRKSAEAVFFKFRATQKPYQLCKEILDTSTVDFVLFETADLIKASLNTEWSILEQTEILFLKSYLLHYLITKPSLASFVKEKIVQVIVTLIKRNSYKNLKTEKETLKEIESFVTGRDIHKQLLGSSIILALMKEYGINDAVEDTDKKLKNIFETPTLKRIFKFCIETLKDLTKTETSNDTLNLIKNLLFICETALMLDSYYEAPPFLTGLMFEVEESNKNPALQLSSSWEDVIFDPEVDVNPEIIPLFFTLYCKLRSNPELADPVRNFLVKLSSLNGSVLDESQNKLSFVYNYVENFLKFLSDSINKVTGDVKDKIFIDSKEALSIAYIFDNLISFFGVVISSFSQDEQTTFLEIMTHISCSIAKEATHEEFSLEDYLYRLSRNIYMEAFENILQTWILLMKSENALFPIELKEQSLVKIFNTFMPCHLSPPDGDRTLSEKKEFNSKEISSSFYTILGKFERRILGYSLPTLDHQIKSRTETVKNELNRLSQHTDKLDEHLSNLSLSAQPLQIENLFEDLHWLVIFSGHLICKHSNEGIIFPSDLRYENMKQFAEGQVDLPMLMKVLESFEAVIDARDTGRSTDQVTQLITDILKLCEITKVAIKLKIVKHPLPKLCGTLMWFLRRWSLCYLKNNYFDDRVIGLNSNRYERDSILVTNKSIFFIIETVQCYLVAFKDDPAIVEEITRLLNDLIDCTNIANKVVKLDNYRALVDLTVNNQDLPQTAKRNLMLVIVKAAYIYSDKYKVKEYYAETFGPLLCRFQNIIYPPVFQQNFHQEEIRVQIVHILECLVGAGKQETYSNITSIVEFMSPVFENLPNLFNVYQNHQYITLIILELYLEYSYLSQYFSNDLCNFINIFSEILKVYANNDRILKLINKLVTEKEDDCQQEFLLTLKILTNLLNFRPCHRNLLEFTYDVCLLGLNIMLPGISVDLLKIPSICKQYFEMTELFCKLSPEKICSLPDEKLQVFLRSVELGLVSCGNESTIHSCYIIKHLTLYIYQEKNQQQFMAPFLNLLLKLIVTHQINAEHVKYTCSPLYYLIDCFKEQYQRFVQDLTQQYSDPTTIQKLSIAFDDLIVDYFSFDSFSINFKKFVCHFYSLDQIKGTL